MNTINNDNTRPDTTNPALSQHDGIRHDNNIGNFQEHNETNIADNHLLPQSTNDATVPDNSRPDTPSHGFARHDTTDRDKARPGGIEPGRENLNNHSNEEQEQNDFKESEPEPNSIEESSMESSLGRSSWIEIQQTIEELERQGIKRTVRSIQRYCNRGKLTCKLVPTENAVRYLIEKFSIAAFVKRHNESMPSQGFSAQSEDTERSSNQNADQQTDSDKSHIAQSNQQAELILSLKDQQIEILKSQLEVTNNQLGMKDEQISAMLERDHETNVLIQNLQNLMALPSAGQTSSYTKDINPNGSTNFNNQKSPSSNSVDTE